MAITQIRAQLDGQWVALVYNEATRRYEATLTPTATSFHQPGGAYSVTVEATNDSGIQTTADGSSIPGLLLTVRETVSPVLTIESPAGGYVTTGKPTLTLTATDESDGSGIDPSTLTVTLDGAAWAGGTLERGAIDHGFRFRFVPTDALPDGAHAIQAEIADYDGNTTQAGVRFTIDTTPPTLTTDRILHVVDVPALLLTGQTNDITAPPVTVTVENNGELVGQADVLGDGTYKYMLALDVGENNIILTATDGAGLTTTCVLYVIRLITDRTAADVSTLRTLLSTRTSWTEAEHTEYLQARHRGAYNHTDLNRVTTAVEYLSAELYRRGYLDPYRPVYAADGRTEWQTEDIPTRSQADGYAANVHRVWETLHPESPEPPERLDALTVQAANEIEKALVETDALFPVLDVSLVLSGEAMSGEF